MHFVDNLNPVLVHLGPLQIRWYGMMYALSFIIGYYLICYLAPKRGVPLDRDDVGDLILYLVAGVLFGGRLVSRPANNFTIAAFHLRLYLSETNGFLTHSQ